MAVSKEAREARLKLWKTKLAERMEATREANAKVEREGFFRDDHNGHLLAWSMHLALQHHKHHRYSPVWTERDGIRFGCEQHFAGVREEAEEVVGKWIRAEEERLTEEYNKQRAASIRANHRQREREKAARQIANEPPPDHSRKQEEVEGGDWRIAFGMIFLMFLAIFYVVGKG